MPQDPTKPIADPAEDDFESGYCVRPDQGSPASPGAVSPFSGVASIWMILHGLKNRLQKIQDSLAVAQSPASSIKRRAELLHLMLDVRDAVKPQGLLFRLRDFFGAADSYCCEHDAHLAQNDPLRARLSLVHACDAIGICLDRAMHLLEETAVSN